MIVFLLPAVLAGLLGLLAHEAEGPEAYVERLRLLLLGAFALAYLGLAVFVWKKARGWRRWGSLLLALVALRVAYVPVVSVAVLLTGWLARIATWLGAGSLGGPLHYGLACFVAALAGLAGLLPVAAAGQLKRPRWIVVLLVYAGVGVLAFWHPRDRAVLPHALAEREGPQPAAQGPGYLDVVEDGERTPHVRILAAFGGLRDVVSPRSGWGGVVREELRARFRGGPGLPLRDRLTALEAALLAARPALEPPPPVEPGPGTEPD